MKIRALLLSASVMTLGWCGTALAQTTPATPSQAEESKDATTVGELIITSERRSENLMTTPIAGTVLSGGDLGEKGVTNIDQLQFVSPGAVVNNFGQGIDFNIRGIGKAEHNSQTMTGVITYRDGVATFPGYFTAEPYYDIASVEILRGPQGTLVGENATGGAVFVTTNNPIVGGGYTGYIAGQLGNYNDVAVQGAVNLPISDTFAARIAFNGEQRDSFYDVSGPATGNEGLRMGSVRFSALWTPTAALTVNFKTDYSHLDFGGYPADPVNSTNDLFDITANTHQMAVDELVRSVLRVDYVFDNGVTLRSVSGYQDGNTSYAADLDGTSTTSTTFKDSVDETIVSQELNLISSSDGPFTWVVGAYFQSDKSLFPKDTFIVSYVAGNPVYEYNLWGRTRKQNTAVFAQAAYDLTPSLKLTVGARYSDSRSKNVDVNILQWNVPLLQNQSVKSNNVSGKVSLGWTVDDHNYLYAFVATGYKPGGLNVPVGLGTPEPFKPETVTNYEAGWKAGWLGGRLRTQINAYYNDYENFQVIVAYPLWPVFGFELNNPNKTTIYGVEAQAEAVFGPLSIDAGLGWTHSELGEFYATDSRIGGSTVCDPKTGAPGVSATCFNLKGRQQTYAPEFTFNIGAQYRFNLANGDTITPRLNYGYVSEQWATLFQNEARGDRIEARNIFNAQLAWTHGDLVATLYSTNATDQHYVAAINSGLRFAGPPRQFGIRLMKVF